MQFFLNKCSAVKPRYMRDTGEIYLVIEINFLFTFQHRMAQIAIKHNLGIIFH